MIKFYRVNEPHGYMSNYKKARFFIYGRWWNWVEAAYQSQKTSVPSEIDTIWQAKTNNDSRLLGQKVTMRSDWDQVKDQVMYECCVAKFVQHPELLVELLATGSEELVENTTKDMYWGCGTSGDGQNKLGQILMKIRNDLAGYNVE